MRKDMVNKTDPRPFKECISSVLFRSCNAIMQFMWELTQEGRVAVV